MSDKKALMSSWVEIDLSALNDNLSIINKRLPKQVRVMAVVKADAYGHGLVPVARTLAQAGINHFALANLQEALTLRNAGINGTALILSPLEAASVNYLLKYDLSVAVSSKKQCFKLNQACARSNKRLKVHIEIETGMGRFGFDWRKPEDIAGIKAFKFLDVEGIFTHFSKADNDINFTQLQVKRFNRVLSVLNSQRICPRLIHAANSAGIINCPQAPFNFVRPGLLLYGLSWSKKLTQQLGLKPVMSLKSKVVFLRRLPGPLGIGYGCVYKGKKGQQIATISCGYAHGLSRALSGKMEFIIRGRKAPQIARICMDNVMVDVKGLKNIREFDEVLIFGKEGPNRIYAEDLAQASSTIAYEIVTSAGNLNPRIYI